MWCGPGLDSSSRLAHLAQEPKVRKDRVFEAQPLFACRLRAEMTALGCTSQFRVQLRVVLTVNAQVSWNLAVPPERD